MYKDNVSHPKQRAEKLNAQLRKNAFEYHLRILAEKVNKLKPYLEEKNSDKPPEEKLDTSWIDTFYNAYGRQSKPKAI